MRCPPTTARRSASSDLAPIADPDITLDQVEEGKPLVFTAEVEVRPRLELDRGEYRGIEGRAPVGRGGRRRGRRAGRARPRAVRGAGDRRAPGRHGRLRRRSTSAGPCMARRSPRPPSRTTCTPSAPASSARSWTGAARQAARRDPEDATTRCRRARRGRRQRGRPFQVLVKEVKAQEAPAARRRAREDGLRVRHPRRAPRRASGSGSRELQGARGGRDRARPRAPGA